MSDNLHCIFDLDGTLFDSHQQIINAVAWTRKKNQLEELDASRIKELIGLPAKHLFTDVGLDQGAINSLVVEFRERLKTEIAISNNLFPGVIELFINLKSRGARLSVATTKPTELAQWTIQHSKLDVLLDHVQGTDNFKPKPDPEVILRCIRLSSSSKVLMFGDRTEDMFAAKSAKVLGVGMAQTIHSQAELRSSGADYTFESFSSYQEIIDTIYQE